MCVKYVRFAPMRRAASVACSMFMCVGCGRRRSASMTSTSTPRAASTASGGTALQSVM